MFQSKSKNKPKRWMSFSARRFRGIAITAFICAIVAIIVYAQNQSLLHGSFTSGYILMGTIVFLTALNWRKKLTFLPAIGSAAFWMQLHIYMGLATFVFFGFHIGWQVPNGQFECFLALVYLIVALSGVYGLYVTRVYPSRLTGIAEEVVFERIPWFRQRIAAEARELVLDACQQSDVLAKFYSSKLAYFFEKPPSLAYMVHPTGRNRRQLVSDIEELDRYLSDDLRGVSRQLSSMVKQRDDLDYHYALQGRLKVWLFVHIGLTYSLLLMGLLHGILVHAFCGGMA